MGALGVLRKLVSRVFRVFWELELCELREPVSGESPERLSAGSPRRMARTRGLRRKYEHSSIMPSGNNMPDVRIHVTLNDA